MIEVGFAVWDAPDFGLPQVGCVSTQWVDGELSTVVLARAQGCESNDPPDLSISSMDVQMAGDTRQGLTISALLPYAERLASAAETTSEEASKALIRLASDPGTEDALTLNGVRVPAQRFEVMRTGDWAVTSVHPDYAVCVAGRHGLDLPQLRSAELALWSQQLEEQFAEMGVAGPSN